MQALSGLLNASLGDQLGKAVPQLAPCSQTTFREKRSYRIEYERSSLLRTE